ncbi:hypothetical protein LTR37_001382 [Vermiconidia calcicola]|uniref:Uncharacterized protein n=1 Tax=Vermiconidia calcicola TaxID=1690605 RepID=A0ACC3NVE0_9PEZI|nr:hypothetical protein LTR37_001382 [Vermiconidia calcicola]
MNLGWFHDDTDESDFERTTVHEFGHAIGAVHEQFSPDLPITWNRDAVHAAFSDWSKADVDRNSNYFEPVDPMNFVHTKWDPNSIMHYAIKKEWNMEGIEVMRSTTMSDLDKQFIAATYPKP